MPIRIRKRPGYLRWSAAGSFQAVSLAQYFINQLNSGVIIPSGYGGGPWSIPTPGFPSLDFGSGGGETTSPINTYLTHDVNTGLYYTTSFDLDDPLWLAWLGGLTPTQSEFINKAFICPNGSVYVAYTVSGSSALIARADAVGGTFEIIEDFDSISAHFSDSTDGLIVSAIGFNPSAAEEVMYVLGYGGENCKAFIGSGSSFVEGSAFDIGGGLGNGADLTYGDGLWMYTGNGKGAILDGSAALLEVRPSTGYIDNFQTTRHARIGISGSTIHWIDDGDKLTLGIGNLTSKINAVGSDIFFALYETEDGLACNLTGTRLMSRISGPLPAKSDDGGYTWSQITSLTGAGVYFASLSDDEWVTVGDSVQFTSNFGLDWVDKTSNLADLIGDTPALNIIKPVGLVIT